MQNISSLPFAVVAEFVQLKQYENEYSVSVNNWENKCTQGKEPYHASSGDVLILTVGKPETVSDLVRFGRWAFAFVTIGEDKEADDETSQNNETSQKFKVEAFLDREMEYYNLETMYAVFMANIVTNQRIWKVLQLNVPRNSNIVEAVLCTDLVVRISVLILTSDGLKC